MNPAHRAIAESILGAIDWQDDRLGYCQCPGQASHSQKTKGEHCRITMDGAPTIFCFHSSCTYEVEQANRRLRSEIGKYDVRPDPNLPKPVRQPPTLEQIAARKAKAEAERLKTHAAQSLDVILKANAMPMADWWELSLCRLMENPADDWRLLLSLFSPDDIVWSGTKFDSCPDEKPKQEQDVPRWKEWRKHCLTCFRPASVWLSGKLCPGQFTCPSTFKMGTHSRSNENVVTRRFLVIESDCLLKEDMCAIINWCSKFMRLRAIVDTAGKSLHGWFDAPSAEDEAKLRLILPNLGRTGEEETIDSSMFRVAQPCRMPGAERDGKRQCLIYLDNRKGEA